MIKESEDLGLGTKHETNEKRNVNKDGSFNIKKIGAVGGIRDLYQHLIIMSWGKFLMVLLGSYIILNAFFAFAYFLIGTENLIGLNEEQGFEGFMNCFYFSAQTFTTVGYGVISPQGMLTNFTASFEAMLGLLSFALATGLLFGRFSKATTKFAFSENVLLSPYKEGVNGLMLRVANKRNSILLETEAEVILISFYKDEKGEEKRGYHRLELEISEIKMFPSSWTIVHPVNKESPLNQFDKSKFNDYKFEIIVMIKAFDETYGQMVYTRTSYTNKEFVYKAKFKKAIKVNEEGEIELNLNTLGDYDLVDSFDV
jgi:inward rectifier potassium channel